MANTFASDAADFDSTAVVSHASAPSGSISSFFKAVANRLSTAHQHRVDAEIGEFIQAHGGQLTDDLERQISRRFGVHSGQW